MIILLSRTALWVSALNNDALIEETVREDNSIEYHMVGDPTEGSLLVAAIKAGAVTSQLNQSYPRKNEIPFDSEFKRMVTIHAVQDPRVEDISPFVDTNHKDWHVIAVKGAPDLVMNLCTRYQPMHDRVPQALNEETRSQILAANDEMTRDALRVLGVAYRLVEKEPDSTERGELEKDLVFVGLIGMIDPARPEVNPALQTATNAGIPYHHDHR
jgi:Ca2+-transporting ATPase